MNQHLPNRAEQAPVNLDHLARQLVSITDEGDSATHFVGCHQDLSHWATSALRELSINEQGPGATWACFELAVSDALRTQASTSRCHALLVLRGTGAANQLAGCLSKSQRISICARLRPLFESGGALNFPLTGGVTRLAPLRASQDLLDRTGRLGGVGGWELDIATQTLRWSDQTCRIHDLEPGQQPTLAEAISFYAPEAQPVITRAVQHAIASGDRYDMELELTTARATVQAIVKRARAPAVVHQFERERPNGTLLDVRGAPMPGGGFVTTYTDISARKRAEVEVQRSNQLMRGAIDAIDEAFVLFDPDRHGDRARARDAGAAQRRRTGNA